MKLATGILILGMGLGTAGAQNPSIIDTTKAKLNAVQQQKTADSNAALAAAQGQSASAPTSSATKSAAVQPASQAQAGSKSAVSKQASAATQKASPAAKPSPFAPPTATAKASASKTDPAKAKTKKTKTTAVSVKKPAPAKSTVAVEDKKNPDPKKDEHKTISMAGGRRDPFISPVVNHSLGGSGCSTGKRCLAVDQIALQGIVKSDAGMIAVVV